MAWQPVAERTRLVSQKIESGKRSVEAGPHVALGLIAYPALPAASRASDGTTNENGAATQRPIRRIQNGKGGVQLLFLARCSWQFTDRTECE